MLKKCLLFILGATAFWFSKPSAQLLSVTGGIHTNAVRDTVQMVFIFLNHAALTDTTADSVVFLRYRVDGTGDGVFVDRTQTVVDTFSQTNHAGDIGAFTRVVKASDASGVTGSYLVRAIGYKGTTIRQQAVASYTVFDSCPRTWTGTPCPIFATRSTDTVRADIRSWIGTAVATPTVAGVPEVDDTHWNGVAVTGMPMPTYTQPSGFLAATFPSGTIANTTNITAGTISLTAAAYQAIRDSINYYSVNWGDNLIANPSFESSLLHWNVTAGVAVSTRTTPFPPKSGKAVLAISRSGSPGTATGDSLVLRVGDRVSFGGSMAQRIAGAGGQAQFIALVNPAGTVIDSITYSSVTDGQWESQLKVVKIATGGYHSLRLHLGTTADGDSAFFDDVYFRAEARVYATDSIAFADSVAKAPRTHATVTTITGNVNGSVGSVTATVNAQLVNSVTHGGSAAILQLERMVVQSTTAGQPAIKATGNTSGAGMELQGGATAAPGLLGTGGSAGGPGVLWKGGSTGSAESLATTSGHGIAFGIAGTGAEQAPGIASNVADSNWMSLFDPRNDVANSWGQAATTNLNTLGWAQTAAGGGSTDTAAILQMMKNNRFLRHRTAPGNPLDTANAVVTATAGAGAWLCSLLVVDSASNLPVQAVNVWVTTSGALTTDDVPTNSAGNVVFNLDNGTHAAHIFKSLTRLATNSDTIITISGANFKDTISIVSPNIPASPVAGQITVAGNIYDISGDEAEGAVITFALNGMAFFSTADTTNMVAVAQARSVTADSTGYWQINVYPTTLMQASDRRNPVRYSIEIVWPNGTTRYTEAEWTFGTNCCQALQWGLHRWKVR